MRAKFETKAYKNQNDERAVVLSKAVFRAAKFWDISNKQLSQIIGISESSISRLSSGNYLLKKNAKEWELSALFVRAYRGLDAFMGNNKHNEKLWLRAYNKALMGTPIDLMQTVSGLAGVVQYIDCIRGR